MRSCFWRPRDRSGAAASQGMPGAAKGREARKAEIEGLAEQYGTLRRLMEKQMEWKAEFTLVQKNFEIQAQFFRHRHFPWTFPRPLLCMDFKNFLHQDKHIS